MKNIKIKWVAAFLVLAFSFWCGQKLNAQMVGTPYPTPKGCTNVATEGQDFWVTFGNNATQPANQVYLALQLINGNSSAVTVTLTFTATGQSVNYTVPANTSQLVNLDNMQANVYQAITTGSLATTATTNTTLHITCPAFISVIAFNTYAATTDATIVLPTNIWGTDYYNLSYSGAGSSRETHMIIANQNNTNVTITDYTGATQATVTLNAGQVYYGVAATSTQDFTGMHITTNKPVAYFVHNTILYLASNVGAGDILFQQLMPSNQYGQYFLIPNQTQFNTTSQAAAGTNLVRVLAAQDGTTVNFTSANAFTDPGYTQGNGYVQAGTTGSAVSSVTLNKGQWTTVQIAGGQDSYCTVAATQPIAVVNFMQGGNYNPNYTQGDPAICRISPVTNLINTAVIAPFIPKPPSLNKTFLNLASNGNSGNVPYVTPRHYALIIAPTASKNNVTISRNGVSLGTLTAAAVPNVTDPSNAPSAYAPNNVISAPTTWTDVPTPINGVLYSYIRYDFNYRTDTATSFRITAPQGGMLITQAGLGYCESYTFNSGNGGCLVNY